MGSQHAVALILAMIVGPAWPKIERSTAAKDEFRQTHPCPATGQARGACPGWVIDHIIPLCAGGADAPANMQWQALEPSKAKDAQEREQCRALRKAPAP